MASESHAVCSSHLLNLSHVGDLRSSKVVALKVLHVHGTTRRQLKFCDAPHNPFPKRIDRWTIKHFSARSCELLLLFEEICSAWRKDCSSAFGFSFFEIGKASTTRSEFNLLPSQRKSVFNATRHVVEKRN